MHSDAKNLKSDIPKFPQCEAILKTSFHHNNTQCPNIAKHTFKGKAFCRPHAKDAAFQFIFGEEPTE